MWRFVIDKLRTRSVVTSLADLAGVAAITAGVAQIYAPAAYITCGALVLASSISTAVLEAKAAKR